MSWRLRRNASALYAGETPNFPEADLTVVKHVIASSVIGAAVAGERWRRPSAMTLRRWPGKMARGTGGELRHVHPAHGPPTDGNDKAGSLVSDDVADQVYSVRSKARVEHWCAMFR